MSTLTVLRTDGAAIVSGEAADGRATLAAADLPAAIGWELKPEGLCRGDACVPVRGLDGDEVDLGAVVEALGSSLLVDDETATVAISVASADRRAALAGRQAPDFTLPDLDGGLHSLEQFAGRKRLLIAFASW
ncbi:MAG: hypothetical protein DHS20C19_25640 [Acidimicrobiales bacterium]|nr:MAG: hypothetical protein DHS20C19_25640 [Acidimicrobiales bacterium]